MTTGMWLSWLRNGALSLVTALCVSLFTAPAQAASITITPGGLFGYIPLSAFGVAPIAGVGDETIHNVTTSSFSWAGQVWNRIGIVSNGYIVVGGGTNADVSFTNTGFPNAGAPRNVLAPFWANLDPGNMGELRSVELTDGVDAWQVIEWTNFALYGTDMTVTFQVWIETGSDESITFVYEKVTLPPLGLLTIGAQNADGTVGATYYYNGGPQIQNGLQLRVASENMIAETPLPGALPLFATGLGALGLLGWRRKRRAAGASAQA